MDDARAKDVVEFLNVLDLVQAFLAQTQIRYSEHASRVLGCFQGSARQIRAEHRGVGKSKRGEYRLIRAAARDPNCRMLWHHRMPPTAEALVEHDSFEVRIGHTVEGHRPPRVLKPSVELGVDGID